MVGKPYYLAGVALAHVLAPAATAQTSSAVAPPEVVGQSEATGGIEDIVVTARRSNESLQTTPVAVTAVTSIALERAQINDVSQLQNIAPGLVVFPATAQPGSAQFSLRGQSQDEGLIAVDQSVGAYVDGVYVARSSGGLLNLVDVERVEVLRGPQGTLFGRNTTGGAINIVNKVPTGDLEGMVRLRYGNYDAKEAVGVINVPLLGDQLALRAVYQHSDHDGYGRSVLFNERLAWDNTDFVRASLLIAPTDSPIRVLLQGDYTDRRTGGAAVGLKSITRTGAQTGLVALCSGPTAVADCPVKRPAGDDLANYAIDIVGRDNFYDFYLSVPGIYGNAKTAGLSATIDVDLGSDIAFKSITAWRKIDTASLSDNDGTPYVFSGGLLRTDGNQIKQRQISQEIQFSGKSLNDRLKWIVGAFYFKETGLDTGQNYALFPLSQGLSYVDGSVRNESIAGYGQFTFNITDAVRFTGGLRYSVDKRHLVRRNRSETPGHSGNFTCSIAAGSRDPAGFTLPNGTVCQATNDVTYGYMSYTAGLDWELNDQVFLYAKTSRAFRSGGFNTRAVTGGSAVGFAPEKLTDYEIGGKLNLFDRRVRLNLAAFYSDYKNVQRLIPVVVPGTNTLTSGVQNAAAAKIYGFEGELTVRATDRLTLSASTTLLAPKFTSFGVAVTTNSGGVAVADARSTPYSLAPKVSYLLSADYELPVSFGSVNFHGDYAYRGELQQRPPLSYPGVAGPDGYPASFAYNNPDTALSPGYGIFNAQIAFKLEKQNLEIALYGRNLFGKKYIAQLLALQDTALGFTNYLPGDPRTYGISATINF